MQRQKVKSTCFLITLFSVLVTFFTQAQTYSYTGGTQPILEPSINNDFIINVSGLSPSTIDTIHGLESVCLSIQHARVYDLSIYLIAPNGKQVELVTNIGGAGANFTNTCFKGDIATTTMIENGLAPFTGNFLSEEILSKINDGQSGNGNWILRINDYDPAPGGSGSIISWALTFGNAPAKGVHLTSSDLPIIIINTNGTTILHDPKVIVDMRIIYNGPGLRNAITDPFNYSGKIGIEYRGNSSQGFPKKQYGFETMDALGLNEIDTSLLGMPSESDWILNAAPVDKTQLRNPFTYYLYTQMGHYAPRTQPCELILDGEYRGIFVLTEKIKRDKNRVDISKLKSSDISGDNVTGGYIFKVDHTAGSGGGQGWNSQYLSTGNPANPILYQYEYPDADDIMPQQATYIQAFMDSFENVMAGPNFGDPVNGYNKFIDVNQFVDFIILNELTKGPDAYRVSTFFYKDKNSKGGKLKVGPPWDFDASWKNANYCFATADTGWAYNFNYRSSSLEYRHVPFWWEKLMQDTGFTDKLICRWNYLRTTVLDTTYLYATIDSFATLLNESQARNFWRWRVIGQYTWPEPLPLPATYPAEVDRIKEWIALRTAWIDNNLPGTCKYNPAPTTNFIASSTTICSGSSINYTDQSAGLPNKWLWTFEGGTPPTSSISNPTVLYSSPGTYSVSLTSTNATGNGTLTKSSHINVMSCSGINEPTSFSDLQVFPNPASEKVSVRFNVKDQEKTTVRLLNTLSSVIYEDVKNNFSGNYQTDIDLTHLAKGIFFLQITVGTDVLIIKLVCN